MKKKLLAALALWWTGSSPAWAQFSGCPGGACNVAPGWGATNVQVANYVPAPVPGRFPNYQAPPAWQPPPTAYQPWPAVVPMQPMAGYPMHPQVPYQQMQQMQMQQMQMQQMRMQPGQPVPGMMPGAYPGGVVPAAFRSRIQAHPTTRTAAVPAVPAAGSAAHPGYLPPAEPYFGTGLPAQPPPTGAGTDPAPKAAPKADAPEVLPPVDPTPTEEATPGIVDPLVLPAGGVVDNPPEPVIRQYVDPLERPLSKGVLWYGSAEYLRWWLEDQKDVPPQTVTTAAGTTTLQADPDNDERTGGRFHLGRWINPMRTIALEGDFLFLGERTPSSRLSARGITATMIPVFDGIDQVARTIQYQERFLQTELGLRWKALERANWHLDLLAGGRYLELDEGITLTSATTFSQNPVLLSNATVSTVDVFGTDNRFFGGQVGFETEYVCGWWYVQVVGKVAAGNNRQRLTVNGLTAVTAPPQPLGNITVPGGLFAGATNIGHYGRNRFAVVPELGFWTGVRLNRYAKFSLGYDFLWISDVVRPADQLDPAVAQASPLSFLGPPFAPPQPRMLFESTSIWAMGLGLKLELQY